MNLSHHGTDYYFPETINQALELKANISNARFIAGGTDLLINLNKKHEVPNALIDVTHIPELNLIHNDNNHFCIGASVTYSQILQDKFVLSKLPYLAKAIRLIGGTQIRNVGTLVGNIANASPAGDTLPLLYVLKTNIHISGIETKKIIPIEDFILGVRKINLGQEELITHISMRVPAPDELCIFEKLGNRHAMAISVASLAMRLKAKGDRIEMLNVALGSVGPTVMFIEKFPEFLEYGELTKNTIEEFAKFVINKATPIDDIRGSAKYRLLAIKGLILRTLSDLLIIKGKGV